MPRFLSVLAALAACFVGVSALAAETRTEAPPLEPSFPIGPLVVTLVALAGVCAVGFKSSPRNA